MHTMSSWEDDNLRPQELPSYDETGFRDTLTRPPALQDDGRLNIEFDSRTIQALSALSSNRISRLPEYSADDTLSSTSALPSYDSDCFPVALNIVIQVVGSRGDVQPFVALGTELKKHGHRVRLATHNVFDSFVRDAGLEFYPIGGDPAELMAYMVRNPGLIPSMRSLRAGDIKKKRIMVSEMLRGCWLSCVNPDPHTFEPFVADAIIANPPSFAHVHCAQALGIPLHMMFTMPWTSTSAFPHPLVNMKFTQSNNSEPITANYLSYGVVELLTWQGLGDIINEWRVSIDLEPVPFSEGPRLVENLNIPFTYCWSPALVPKPGDWNSNIDVCGFFFREPPNYTPPEDLAKFLSGGAPPVYIGFGSIVIDDPKSLSSMILEAVRITGARALISRGWSKLDGPETPDVMFLGDCPHEWLFQRVSAVIHHGGAGTTACGLLNGKPTTIVPFFGDQPFWGRMVAAAGAGPEPIPQKSLSVEKLVEAIQLCLTPQTAQAAAAIATKMQSENGVKQAVASFHKHLRPYVVECDVLKGLPATWVYARKRNKIRLSKLAADVLLTHLKIDGERLKRLESRRIVIEAQRWDPVTSTLSASVGFATDLTAAAVHAIKRPVKAIARRTRSDRMHTMEAGSLDEHETAMPLAETGTRTTQKTWLGTAQSVTIAAATEVGRLLGGLMSGYVNVLYALLEGLRCAPRLWDQDIRNIDEIHDWISGFLVAYQAFVFGFYDAITGLVKVPARGFREGKAFGAIKGLGEAALSFYTMIFAGTFVAPFAGLSSA
ncbi:Sterol 3-beta-glucosyltransferase UGT80B1 [Paramyrothecium foliicola]|nr:Sterol 3-beta-glucosyltransferase UGT80B1 [Paramyrothecium foliicola]